MNEEIKQYIDIKVKEEILKRELEQAKIDAQLNQIKMAYFKINRPDVKFESKAQ